MPGKRVIPSAYHHVQVAASATWTVQHNLGSNGSQGVPIADVMIETGGELLKVNPMDIEYPNANTLVLTFTGPVVGRATIIV